MFGCYKNSTEVVVETKKVLLDVRTGEKVTEEEARKALKRYHETVEARAARTTGRTKQATRIAAKNKKKRREVWSKENYRRVFSFLGCKRGIR